jgi:hypothetical protein
VRWTSKFQTMGKFLEGLNTVSTTTRKLICEIKRPGPVHRWRDAHMFLTHSFTLTASTSVPVFETSRVHIPAARRPAALTECYPDFPSPCRQISRQRVTLGHRRFLPLHCQVIFIYCRWSESLKEPLRKPKRNNCLMRNLCFTEYLVKCWYFNVSENVAVAFLKTNVDGWFWKP